MVGSSEQLCYNCAAAVILNVYQIWAVGNIFINFNVEESFLLESPEKKTVFTTLYPLIETLKMKFTVYVFSWKT
jgi:hypothetical protein